MKLQINNLLLTISLLNNLISALESTAGPYLLYTRDPIVARAALDRPSSC